MNIISCLDDSTRSNKEIGELKSKVISLTGRVISLSCQLMQEKAKVKQLCDHLSFQSEEEDCDDFWDDEEGWVKL